MCYDKLKSIKSFTQLRKKGSNFIAPAFVILAVENNSNENRNLKIGITTSKKVGNAVVRAKARRRIRAALNLTNPEIFKTLENLEINIICRQKSVTVEIDKLVFYLEKTFTNVQKKFKKN